MLEGLSQGVGHRKLPALPIFGVHHADDFLPEIDIWPGELKKFTASEPCMKGRNKNRLEHLIRFNKQLLHILQREIAQASVVFPQWPLMLDRVGQGFAPFDGLAEHVMEDLDTPIDGCRISYRRT